MNLRRSVQPYALRLLLGAVFALWIFLHWGCFTGRLFFNGDNVSYYRWLTYHFDNIARGVYPFWNPYHAWGSIDLVDVRLVGEFNPFYLLIPVLTAFKVPHAVSFQAVIIMYIFLGCLGFGALTRKLCKDEGLGVLACAMLLFSAFGDRCFTQWAIPMTLVPTIFFFNCLIDFYQAAGDHGRIRAVLGAFFWTMIIVVTYIPLPFLMVLIPILFLSLLFCRQITWEFLKKLREFRGRYPVIMLAGILSVAAALVPVVYWYISSRDSQYVLLMGRGDGVSADKARATSQDANVSGMSVVTSWPELFEDLDITVQSFSYVTSFLILLLLLVAFTRQAFGQAVVFGTGFIIFLIGLADVFPLHRFLYDHVYIFQLFRNYYFLWPAVIAIAVLFALRQLKVFLDARPEDARGRRHLFIFIAAVHLAFGIFLAFRENVIITSYMMVVISFLVFGAYALGFIGRGIILTAGLVAAALVQPCQVIPGFSGTGSQPKEYGVHAALFSYLRPERGSGLNEDAGFDYREKILQDESGFVKTGYLGVKYSYDLLKRLPAGSIEKYVRYKFIVYNNVRYMDGTALDWGQVEWGLKNMQGPALVHDRGAVKEAVGADRVRVISGPSAEFRVAAFDVNRLTLATNFPERAFLVYNDSYHRDWSASIDGKRVPLYRANAAFKGVWVEPGPHVIRWQFMPRAWQLFYLGVTGLFAAWGLVILGAWLTGSRHEKLSQ